MEFLFIGGWRQWTQINIGHYRLRGFTYSLRNSPLRVVAREGSNALPINIFTVTLGFEIIPIITRSFETPPS